MSISLKDFTEKHLSANTEEGQKAIWRKIVPSDLRVHNKVVGTSFWNGVKYRGIIEERWERIHKGDVIDTEWRNLVYVNDDYEYEDDLL